MMDFLYPLGFIASLLFGLRVILQWIDAEKSKKSVVDRKFWIISLIANISLFTHSFIQMQFPMTMVQSCHAVLSWRNLNLMDRKEKRWPLKKVLFALTASATLALTLFVLRCYLFDDWSFMRAPLQVKEVSWQWNILGVTGITLFASRFWVQWIAAEKMQKSYFGLTFWAVCVLGAVLSLIYFIKIGDWVNLVAPALGLIPYLRNLYFVLPKRKSYV